jgi:hypothetical protein
MPDRDPLQSLWLHQREAPFTMTLADLHAQTTRFQSRIRTRNFIEYAAAAAVVATFGWVAFIAGNPVAQAGAALVAVGALYVCWRLHMLASARAPDAAESCLAFHRGELIRQRDALRAIWRWYLGPLVPGLALFWIGVGLEQPTPVLGAIIAAIGLAIGGGVFWGIGALNARAAEMLQKEIDALDRADA